MPINVLIVDDDERERIVIRYMIEQIEGVKIVAEAVHGLEALMICQEKKVDLVFLDITMPEMNGFEVAIKLKTLKEPPLIAFVTVNRNMSVEAFELGALDYIVKPTDQSRIEKTIERAREQMHHKDYINDIVNKKIKERIDFLVERFKGLETFSNILPVRDKGKISLLQKDQIVYCETQHKKVLIATQHKEHLTNFSLNELEYLLDNEVFFRAHQGFIVNLKCIDEIVHYGEGSYQITLIGNSKSIILSRARAKHLRERLGIN